MVVVDILAKVVDTMTRSAGRKATSRCSRAVGELELWKMDRAQGALIDAFGG